MERPPRNGFKLQAMTFITDKDLQEKERKVYSPEYHFGNSWTPTTSLPYAKAGGLVSNTYLSEGAVAFGLPNLAIGGVLWIDNNRIFFTDLRKGQISTLRLRVSSHLPFCAIGAFWLPREERLVIHDIYKYGSEDIWISRKFSERWVVLGKVIKMISEDTDFQGFKLDFPDFTSTDGEVLIVQPEKAGARSFRIHGAPSAASAAATDIPITVATAATAAEVAVGSTTATQLWIAKDPLRSGPEAYILLDNSGAQQGVPAIQGLTASQAVRTGLAKASKVHVRVRWNVHFGRYEVLALV
jgi:hypothetical protein